MIYTCSYLRSTFTLSINKLHNITQHPHTCHALKKKLHQEVLEGKDTPALCSLVLCWLGFYKLDMNESHWEEKSFRWGTVFGHRSLGHILGRA